MNVMVKYIYIYMYKNLMKHISKRQDFTLE